MWRKEGMFFIFLIITGSPVAHSVRETVVVGGDEKLLLERGDNEKNTILLQEPQHPLDKEVLTEAREDVDVNVRVTPKTESEGDGSSTETQNEGIHFKGRNRRQSQRTAQSLLDSVTQECNGITLRWLFPNIPFSPNYHSSTTEFSHYNIYRETNYFSTVVGLNPIASGKDHKELQQIHVNRWTDKFPPINTGLFYAVTAVDHKGKEAQTVAPKQITFIASVEKTGMDPTRIIPNLLKGDILHHSLALNTFRNEYMVAFDLDINKDGRPDQVFAARVNGLGHIIAKTILNATVSIVSKEQGRPSVAFNPTTQQYLIAFQITAPSLLGGVSIIVGQRVLGHRSDRYKNPYVILKATGTGGAPVPVVEPKIIYNSASGGFAMAAMIISPPKTAFAVVLNSNGNPLSIQRLFQNEVFDINLFMDTKARQVYFVYQIAQRATTVISGQHSFLNSFPYYIVTTKINSTGALLSLNDPNTVRNLVGFTKEKHANIAGYFNENNGWLTVFWNNEENGKKIINSSIIFGVPGKFLREENRHDCPTQTSVQNPVSCFLPNNNAHILLWEEGQRLGGFLIKDDTFHTTLGEQRQPQLVYNQQQQRTFVVWKQKIGGDFVLLVRNINPGSHFSCRTPCNVTEKCAMKDVCAPRNSGVSKYLPTCAKNNGGCSHTCLTNQRGVKCSCPSARVLSLDGMKCFLKDAKPDVSLLYSSVGSIWSVKVYHKEKRTTFTRIPIQGQEIISFFYNKKDKYLYWADAKAETINRALLDGSKKQELINSQILLPDGMVVDSNAKHLYWTDGGFKSIFRCSLDGNSRATFMAGLDMPRALALHQANKWLYWSDWGALPKIERVNTDGSNRQVIIQTGLGWPNGLTVDRSHLYWADAKLDSIEMSDLNGQGRIVITKKGVFHPYGLAIAGNRLYWTDWSGGIHSVDKKTSFSSADVIAVGIAKPYSLQVYDGTVVSTATFCTDPGIPSFGGRNPSPVSGGKYKIGDRIVFTCNPGFVHLGSNERRCLSTGKWSGTDTQCKALPTFTILPINQTVPVGFPVTLGCSASSKSGLKPKIQWYKNGVIPSSNGRYAQLSTTDHFFITNTVVDDTGTYTCSATNDAGQVRASMFLRVKSQTVADCGKAKFGKRAKISGGHRATPGSIPWQILLWNKSKQKPFCGGSLLNARWGITAAHCLRFMQFADIEVRLGEHDWKVHEKTEQHLSIDRAHIHSQYRESTFDSDIALFHFKTKAIMTDYIKPICLPVSQSDQALLQPGNIGIVSGWGARNNKKNKTRPVRKLHQVDVPLVSDTTCKQNHPGYVVTSNMLCAGRLNGLADACRGDSGGPLTVENKVTGRSVLLGIVSWGDKKCGAKNKYGVYTKVPIFLNWINNYIKNV